MRIRDFLSKPVVVALLLGHMVFAVIVGVRSVGALEPLELSAYDQMLRLRPAAAADERVVVIGETESDLQRFGHPLSDATMAKALQRLAAHEPRVIGVDKYRDIPVPPGTDKLDATLANLQQVVWIFQFGNQGKGHIEPPQALKGTGRVGFNDLVDDRDGIVRRGLLFLDDGQSVYYSFPLLLALRYLAADGIQPKPDPEHPQYLRLGPTTIAPLEASHGSYVDADAAGYQFLLDYRGMPNALTTYTLSQLMDGEIPDGALGDRVVLLGGTAESLTDYVYTPFSGKGEGSRHRLYGVELQGHITAQLLRFAYGESDPVRSLSETTEAAWIWLWAVAGAVAGLWLRSVIGFALITGLGLMALGGTAYALFLQPLWIPLVPPGLAWVAGIGFTTAYLSALEKRQRQLLMNIFSRHVSKDVADAIWQARDQFLEGGRPKPQRLTATVLFTDIRGFTSVSERMDAQALMQWLNRYMEQMASLIIDHRGVINKYIGDAIMALFGVPIPRSSDAQVAEDANNAVRAALAMGRQLERLNRELEAEGLPPIGMRVGIYTGTLVAGSLGSSERCEYTVIGDTVNTASRLESYGRTDANPEADDPVCRILIGEPTRRLLDDAFPVRHVGSVKLKGKAEEVPIYRVLREGATLGDVNMSQPASAVCTGEGQ